MNRNVCSFLASLIFLISSPLYAQRLCNDSELLRYNLFMDYNQLEIDKASSELLISNECRDKMCSAATDLKNDIVLCGKTLEICEKKTQDNIICKVDVRSDDKDLCASINITINVQECLDYIML